MVKNAEEETESASHVTTLHVSHWRLSSEIIRAGLPGDLKHLEDLSQAEELQQEEQLQLGGLLPPGELLPLGGQQQGEQQQEGQLEEPPGEPLQQRGQHGDLLVQRTAV